MCEREIYMSVYVVLNEAKRFNQSLSDTKLKVSYNSDNMSFFNGNLVYLGSRDQNKLTRVNINTLMNVTRLVVINILRR